MEKTYRLGQVEEIIAGMELAEVPDDILESGEDYEIVISGWWVHVPELGLNLCEGIFCNYDKEEDANLPDFSVTVVKEEEEEEWIYYEQDGFVITLANFLHGKMDIGQLEQLFCFIRMPEESLPVKE